MKEESTVKAAALLTALSLSDGPWFSPVKWLQQDLLLQVPWISASLLEPAPCVIPMQECHGLADLGSQRNMGITCCQCSDGGWCSAACSLPQVIGQRTLRQLRLHNDLFIGSVAGTVLDSRGNSFFLGEQQTRSRKRGRKGSCFSLWWPSLLKGDFCDRACRCRAMGIRQN